MTANSDCNHEIKRWFLLGRKAMKNQNSVLKSRGITANKGPYSQSNVISSSHVWMWELDNKEGWVPKHWCLRNPNWKRSKTLTLADDMILYIENPKDITRKLLSSVQFSHSVVSDSLQPRELQHARPPCPSPTPRAYSNSCPSNKWCHSANSSSAVPFSSCLQSFPATGNRSFQMTQLFAGQSLEFQLQHQSFQWTPRTNLL